MLLSSVTHKIDTARDYMSYSGWILLLFLFLLLEEDVLKNIEMCVHF